MINSFSYRGPNVYRTGNNERKDNYNNADSSSKYTPGWEQKLEQLANFPKWLEEKEQQPEPEPVLGELRKIEGTSDYEEYLGNGTWVKLLKRSK